MNRYRVTWWQKDNYGCMAERADLVVAHSAADAVTQTEVTRRAYGASFDSVRSVEPAPALPEWRCGCGTTWAVPSPVRCHSCGADQVPMRQPEAG